jgi:hypothetical protein
MPIFYSNVFFSTAFFMTGILTKFLASYWFWIIIKIYCSSRGKTAVLNVFSQVGAKVLLKIYTLFKYFVNMADGAPPSI